MMPYLRELKKTLIFFLSTHHATNIDMSFLLRLKKLFIGKQNYSIRNNTEIEDRSSFMGDCSAGRMVRCEVADLERGDNINVMLSSPKGGTLGRLCKSEKVELCCLRPHGDGDNIGLSGWLGRAHIESHPHTHIQCISTPEDLH